MGPTSGDIGHLNLGQILAYPTETVLGFRCIGESSSGHF